MREVIIAASFLLGAFEDWLVVMLLCFLFEREVLIEASFLVGVVFPVFELVFNRVVDTSDKVELMSSLAKAPPFAASTQTPLAHTAIIAIRDFILAAPQQPLSLSRSGLRGGGSY